MPETEVGSIMPNTPSIIKVEAIRRSFEGGRIEKGVQAHALMHTYDMRINVQKKADGSLFVWTIDKDSTAHHTMVCVGATTRNRISISSGIGSDERVVTEGYQKLSEGTRVVF